MHRRTDGLLSPPPFKATNVRVSCLGVALAWTDVPHRYVVVTKLHLGDSWRLGVPGSQKRGIPADPEPRNRADLTVVIGGKTQVDDARIARSPQLAGVTFPPVRVPRKPFSSFSAAPCQRLPQPRRRAQPRRHLSARHRPHAEARPPATLRQGRYRGDAGQIRLGQRGMRVGRHQLFGH
jgi:hypothetical protein